MFDRAQFDEVVKHLPSADVAVYLRTLVATCLALAPALRMVQTARADAALSETAHRLAAHAGGLGFTTIVQAARNLELAANTGAPDLATRAAELANAITSAMPTIQRELDRFGG